MKRKIGRGTVSSMRKTMKKIGYGFCWICCFLTGLVLCMPVIVILSGSLMSPQELSMHLKSLINGSEGIVSFSLLPFYPTGAHYIKLLFYTPEFYVVFFNSLKLTGCILLGQLLMAVPGAWAFAVYRFPFRKQLFTLYVVLMLMPFQVTMLSQYLVLDNLQLMNTQWAIILPAVFSTFPVFLIYRYFNALPGELFEAAGMDGAGEWQIFVHVGLPLASEGIISAMVLGFLEYWNLIEQPLAFLEDQKLWPLSLYLPEISLSNAGTIFAASVITLIPPLFVFLFGQDYLEQGIAASAIKQ